MPTRGLFLLGLVSTLSLVPALGVRSIVDSTLTLNIANRGTVVIELFSSKAPKTTAHISKLASSGFYNGQRFHRVVRRPRPYLVQIGDPASKSGLSDSVGSGGSGARIPFENSGQKHTTGAVALSAIPGQEAVGDSQFYILLADAPFLDGSYTVFGKVVQGMDVVNKIERGDVLTTVTVNR
jgi:cyclophilin family peptidyl-prolyl cis-trans isomerase